MKNHLKPVLIAVAIIFTVSTFGQIPKLNSYPSASATLFLDFDGHTVTGTSWNSSGPINCGASGLDDVKINTIFNRVSEDFRPFDVNVTTDSSKFLSAPLQKRMRAIVTVTSSWFGSAGGVAFIGSFTWGDDTPCFIFSALLGYNEKKVAEAISHELGHTLGLFHQSTYDANCVKVSDYNYGQGTGEIGWAPIMGAGYYQNLTSWNNGPNSFGCTNLQNDLDIITSLNGFSYRADDHAATFAGATVVSFAGNLFAINGMIEKNNDQDIIRFSQPSSGRFQLNANPYSVSAGNTGSNLDIQVTLYNSSQTTLDTYNPATLLSSVIDTILSPGDYYLKIEGKGNIYAPNYSMMGEYSLQGIFTNGIPLPVRKLELNGEVKAENHSLTWEIDADEQVVEQVLEYSTDGRNFSSTGALVTTDRSFNKNPFPKKTVQYRLQVTFDNGKKYYSNVVTLRSYGTVNKPQLLSNLVNSTTVTIISPDNFDYIIFDLTGKVTKKGKLSNGTNIINTNLNNGGIYMIRYSNGTEQWTDKIMRQ